MMVGQFGNGRLAYKKEWFVMMAGWVTVSFFSNETKDDDITRKRIDGIKFWKKRQKEYVLAFIHAKF